MVLFPDHFSLHFIHQPPINLHSQPISNLTNHIYVQQKSYGWLNSKMDWNSSLFCHGLVSRPVSVVWWTVVELKKNQQSQNKNFGEKFKYDSRLKADLIKIVNLSQAEPSWAKLSWAKSTWVELSQPESTWINLSQPESSWIKLSQPELSYWHFNLRIFNTISLFKSLGGFWLFFSRNPLHSTASNRTNKPILSTSRKSA